jgi:hypothetical protein
LIYQDEKAGWCDKDGKFIINPQFESAEVFGESKIACVKSGDKYGYIDSEGKIAINPQFDSASKFIEDKIASIVTQLSIKNTKPQVESAYVTNNMNV